MKIAFLTEMSFNGKVSRTHINMRTEFAWMAALNADHYNISSHITEYYDLIIVIIPKQRNHRFDISLLKDHCKAIAVMQEGPNWYWQDYEIHDQIWYYNTIAAADIIFVHNEIDKKYYHGLTGHPDVRVMQSLMIHDAIGELEHVERANAIIGGNFVSWYGGFDSYAIANVFGGPVYAPSMGRKQILEEQVIQHLPYLTWREWIHALNKFKYGVHLMRTHAAGTFALNCGYLGIPCIGYKGLDTQELIHSDLTVDVGDLHSARQLATRLRNDGDFYIYCAHNAMERYNTLYTEEQFINRFYS
jgi:hypothetical protein